MAKRSRKARKTSKPVQFTPVAGVPVVEKIIDTDVTGNGGNDYIDNYYYVFTDMRTMIVITLIMLVVMFALTFII